MARRTLTARDRENIVRFVPGDWTQAQYVHPGSYTSEHLLMADASARYIAIPTVNGTYSGKPSYMRLYRDDNWYLSLNTMADTRFAGKFNGGVEYMMPVHPHMDTLSWAATVNTGKLDLNWGWE